MLISLAARCASTTPLNADAKNIRVIEWWSGSPNEVEVNSVMDCPALGRPEKGDDRNALINLGAARGANIVLLKIPKGKSVMAVPTYGADFEATFYRCAQVNGMSHALGIDPRSSPTRTLSDEVKQE